MNKQNQNKPNIPELRFPEFSGEWEEKTLGELVEVVKGNNQNTNLPVMTISAKRGWLNQEERFSQVIAGNSLKKYTELNQGDFSYNKGNSKVAQYGIVYKLPVKKALVPNVYKSFRALNNVDENYLEQYFHSKILDRQLRTRITSTARMDGLLNISDTEFFSIKLKIPIFHEQQKIGDFFSKLDQQIELEEKKLALLEEQKKGYMQKIFSQELRFKDENGNDYPEWEEYEIDQKFNFFDKYRKPIEASKRIKGIYPYYGATGIIDFIDDYIFDGEYILIGEDGANIISRNSPLVYITRGKIWVNNHAHILQPKKGNTYYFYTLLDNVDYSKYNTGTAQPKLNIQTIKKIKCKFSESQKEQQKIGRFFEKMDLLIKQSYRKIERLASRKKALLQRIYI